jgi:hypothetical protein
MSNLDDSNVLDRSNINDTTVMHLNQSIDPASQSKIPVVKLKKGSKGKKKKAAPVK